jgi:polysaccharide deacetylase family protein (PEP-CTERM system associated)
MTGPIQAVNAFTVDLEDWFQGLTSTNPKVDQWPSFESRVVQATELLLKILRTHRVQATFFVLGYVADRHPELVEQIQGDGHEIGVHGYFHRFIYRMTRDEFARELERSIEAIVRITGEMPLGHRAPYFSVSDDTPWVFDVLQTHNIRYDSSIFPTRNMLYGIPNAPRFPHHLKGDTLMEFPLSTIRLGGINWPMAGGFYLRALPYALVRWGISRLNRQGHPAIMYMHPWELDCGQTYNQVTFRERITHYHGRQGLAKKLHRLFTEFRFSSLRSLLELQDTLKAQDTT